MTLYGNLREMAQREVVEEGQCRHLQHFWQFSWSKNFGRGSLPRLFIVDSPMNLSTKALLCHLLQNATRPINHRALVPIVSAAYEIDDPQ